MRSHALMRALEHTQSSFPVHTEFGHGSRTAVSHRHSMHIFEIQTRPNSPNVLRIKR